MAQDSRRPTRASRHQPDPWGADTQPPAFPAGSDPFDVPMINDAGAARNPPPSAPAAIPVYASHPRRLGIAALLIAACVIVALVSFVSWKVRQDEPTAPAVAQGDRDQSVMSAFPPDATPQRAPAQPDSGTVASPPPASSGSSAAVTAPAADASAAAAPVEIKPLPAKPARKRSAAPAEPRSTPPAPPAAAVQPSPVPERPQVAAVAPKAPVIDRWTQMNDELARCTREDFIARVICDQRVRFRYCKGYWGTIPQCPGSPAPERG